MKYLKLFSVILLVVFLALSVNFHEVSAEVDEVTESQIQQLEELAQRFGIDPEVLFTALGIEVDFCYDFRRNILFNSTGEDVRNLQTALQREGFLDNYEKRDGEYHYWVDTIRAMQQFIESHNLSTGDLMHDLGLNFRSSSRRKMIDLYSCRDDVHEEDEDDEDEEEDEEDVGDIDLPIVRTSDDHGTSGTGVMLEGELQDDGGSNRVKVGFEWTTNAIAAHRGSFTNESMSEERWPTIFRETIEDLERGETYYYRAVAENEAGRNHGTMNQFTIE